MYNTIYMIWFGMRSIWSYLVLPFHLLEHSATFEAPSQLDWKQYGHLGGLQLVFEICVPQNPVVNFLFKG